MSGWIRAAAVVAALVASLLTLAGPPATASATPPGPWDVAALQVAPTVSWGTPVDHGDYSVTPLYYDNVEYLGEPTRVFAYYAAPDTVVGTLPAVALVHGGGGAAYAAWAAQWAQAGYAALAMDLAGNGPGGTPLADGGPPLSQDTAFRNLATGDLTDLWVYQATAAVIRGVSVLAAQPQVDDARIGMMGISWGGYLTEVVSGLDERLAFAIPVYGAGFHLEHSYWTGVLLDMAPADRATWVANFDPQHYLPYADLPMLFVTGTNDPFFPLDSWRRSVALVPGPTTLRVIQDWPHDHWPALAAAEPIAFADQQVRGGVALPEVTATGLSGGVATATYSSPTTIVSATLTSTTSSGTFPSRSWQTGAATVHAATSTVSATLPVGATSYFLTLVDSRGYRVTSVPEDVPVPAAVVVDNVDAGFSVVSGTWYTSSGLAGRYGADYRYAVTSPTGTATARWSPVLPAAGSYEVSVWYPASSNRCSTCTYTVRSGATTFTAVADQTASGGQWVKLGTYDLDPAGPVSVEVSNRADGIYVQADAVRFELSDAVVVDNADAGFSVVSGTWYTSSGLAGRYGADYRYANTSPTGTATVRWVPVLPGAGSYEVAVWYPASSNRCTTCSYTIRSGNAAYTAAANQTISGGTWVVLGSFALDPAAGVSVELGNRADGTYVQADAVRFDPE